jgi:hypothetical protein
MGRLSFEEKTVLNEMIKPELELKHGVVNELYKSGTQQEIDEVLDEISILNSILNKLNIKI